MKEEMFFVAFCILNVLGKSPADAYTHAWSYSTCSASSTPETKNSLSCELCSHPSTAVWSFNVRVIPSDPTKPHEFESTVDDIKNDSISVKVKRVDENTLGWEQMSVTFIVMGTATSMTEYIRTRAYVHYNLEDGNYELSGSDQRISKLIDQAISNIPAEQNTTSGAGQPILAQNAKRKYMEFSGDNERLISNIDLNVKRGDKDLVTVFVVYRIGGVKKKQFLCQNGLFGSDNLGYDKFICFTRNGSMVVSGTEGNTVTVSQCASASVKPGAVGRWNVISVQWNLSGGQNGSSAWCNGKEVARFKSRTVKTDSRVAIGDLEPSGKQPFRGSIGEFLMYKNHYIADRIMKKHHQYLMEKWAIPK